MQPNATLKSIIGILNKCHNKGNISFEVKSFRRKGMSKELRLRLKVIVVCSVMIVLALVYKLVLGSDFLKNLLGV